MPSPTWKVAGRPGAYQVVALDGRVAMAGIATREEARAWRDYYNENYA